MPEFQYQGRDRDGGSVKGSMTEETSDAVASRLIDKNITPVRITKVAVAPAAARKSGTPLNEIDLLARFRTVSKEELIVFSREMYTLTRAGIALNRAFRGLSGMARNPLLKETLEQITDDLEGGLQLASCIARHPRVFPPLYVSLIRAGEGTGQLEQAFNQASDYLELERETAKRIKSATRYPIFVILAMAVAVGVVTVYVIPAFADMFKSFGAELPWQTRALLATSAFFVEWGAWLLGGFIVGLYFFRRYIQTPLGAYRWGRAKLRLPVVGTLFERINLGRFCRTFATLLRAGLPITQALRIVGGAVGNAFLESKIRDMAVGIERGESLLRTASNAEMFTPIILQMIAVGEETGSIDDLLDEVAAFYEREVDYDLKRLTDVIEPILALLLGGLVLILALGIFLPLWDMATVAG